VVLSCNYVANYWGFIFDLFLFSCVSTFWISCFYILVFCFWSLMEWIRVELNGMEVTSSSWYKVTQVPRPRPQWFPRRFLLTAPPTSSFLALRFLVRLETISEIFLHISQALLLFPAIDGEPARLQSPTWPTLACRSPHLLHNFWFAATAAVVVI